jgi:hypothetical protein
MQEPGKDLVSLAAGAEVTCSGEIAGAGVEEMADTAVVDMEGREDADVADAAVLEAIGSGVVESGAGCASDRGGPAIQPAISINEVISTAKYSTFFILKGG